MYAFYNVVISGVELVIVGFPGNGNISLTSLNYTSCDVLTQHPRLIQIRQCFINTYISVSTSNYLTQLENDWCSGL